MSNTTSKVFLVTGASSGLGLSLSRAILAAGHRLIATMRDPSKTPDVVTELSKNGNGVCLPLDVTSPSLENDLEPCISHFGHVDVLVNNAGYGYGGPLEDCDLDKSRQLVETLFWGPIRLTKALIPLFRKQGGGTVINITSAEAVSGQPALLFYSAAKHALDGASEALAGELAPFGIRVIVAQPGGMRTAFMKPERMHAAIVSEAYSGTPAEWVMNAVRAMDGTQALDPEQCAKRIVEAAVGGGKGWPAGGMGQFLRLSLGKEVMGRWESKIKTVNGELEHFSELAKSCDFPEGS